MGVKMLLYFCFHYYVKAVFAITIPKAGQMHNTFIVVGGTSGLGRSIAETLVNEGKKVVVIGNVAKEVEATQIDLDCYGLVCDVSQPLEVEATLKRAFTEFGPVAGLAHCAARWVSAGPFHEVPAHVLEATTQINLLGAMYVASHAINHLLQQGDGGRLLFVSAMAAERPAPGIAAYAAQKAGVKHLALSLAQAYGKDDIKIATISPGAMPTKLQERVGAEFTDEHWADAADVGAAAAWVLTNKTNLVLTDIQIVAAQARW